MDQSQDITLKRAVEIGQQFELSQAQVKFMRGEEVLKSHKKHPTKSTVSHAKRGPVTLTPNAERLALELSLPVLTTELSRSWDSITQPSARGANALAHIHRHG